MGGKNKVSVWMRFRSFISKLSCKATCCNSDCKIDKNQLIIDIDDLRFQIGSLNDEIKIVKQLSIIPDLSDTIQKSTV